MRKSESRGQEKGVDVSIAIDLIRLTHENAYDLGIIVSQDWDFGPAIEIGWCRPGQEDSGPADGSLRNPRLRLVRRRSLPLRFPRSTSASPVLRCRGRTRLVR